MHRKKIYGIEKWYMKKKQREKVQLSNKFSYVRDYSGTKHVGEDRREYGIHFTSVEIFKSFILPHIKDELYKYIWVDLFAGEGNLILPILRLVSPDKRVQFFEKHIFLFDIQNDMVEKCITKAKNYGIPESLARKNIQVRDTLLDYPQFLKDLKLPIYHITNPPYLYLGYIVKNSERNTKYFNGQNEGYQDLYQIALMNDLRNGIEKMIYIIPTNFLFGYSVSNKIRKDFLPFYRIREAFIFEKKIFQYTGTNVCICFFERKARPANEIISFRALKINKGIVERLYRLSPNNFYRAGGEFDEFVSSFRMPNPLNISFYLLLEEILKNKGEFPVRLLDVNSFSNGYYKCELFHINKKTYEKLLKNPLFVRTLDTGGWEGRVGIYNIKDVFGVDGIVVTKQKYRTHPIQIFITPSLPKDDIELLKNYFNLMLEYFRNITDSEFLTTFKYSNSYYIRKYLGLSQVRKLLETFPRAMSQAQKNLFKVLIEQKNIERIKELLYEFRLEKGAQVRLFHE